jgi:hypothetical protein
MVRKVVAIVGSYRKSSTVDTVVDAVLEAGLPITARYRALIRDNRAHRR